MEGKLSLKLTNFEGPMDLLLDLVKVAKIAIKDIFLSDVTQQFLDYMIQLKEIDFEEASEYMVIAAELIENKSRQLLPSSQDEKIEEDNSENSIIRKLEEYSMLKEASKKLKENEVLDRLYKASTNDDIEDRFIPKDFTLDALLDAFANMIARMDATQTINAPKEIVKDSFSVSDRVAYIQHCLLQADELHFTDFFIDSCSKNQVVVTFSAMLELLKLQCITVVQEEVFGTILIKLNKNFNKEIVFNEENS